MDCTRPLSMLEAARQAANLREVTAPVPVELSALPPHATQPRTAAPLVAPNSIPAPCVKAEPQQPEGRPSSAQPQTSCLSGTPSSLSPPQAPILAKPSSEGDTPYVPPLTSESQQPHGLRLSNGRHPPSQPQHQSAQSPSQTVSQSALPQALASAQPPRCIAKGLSPRRGSDRQSPAKLPDSPRRSRYGPFQPTDRTRRSPSLQLPQRSPSKLFTPARGIAHAAGNLATRLASSNLSPRPHAPRSPFEALAADGNLMAPGILQRGRPHRSHIVGSESANASPSPTVFAKSVRPLTDRSERLSSFLSPSTSATASPVVSNLPRVPRRQTYPTRLKKRRTDGGDLGETDSLASAFTRDVAAVDAQSPAADRVQSSDREAANTERASPSRILPVRHERQDASTIPLDPREPAIKRLRLEPGRSAAPLSKDDTAVTKTSTCRSRPTNVSAGPEASPMETNTEELVANKSRAPQEPLDEHVLAPPPGEDEEELSDLVSRYGLVIVERDVETNEAIWIACKFCPIFGCKGRNAKYIMAYVHPFNATSIRKHVENSHNTEWERYKEADANTKAAFFDVKPMPAASAFHRRVSELKSAWNCHTAKGRELRAIAILRGRAGKSIKLRTLEAESRRDDSAHRATDVARKVTAQPSPDDANTTCPPEVRIIYVDELLSKSGGEVDASLWVKSKQLPKAAGSPELWVGRQSLYAKPKDFGRRMGSSRYALGKPLNANCQGCFPLSNIPMDDDPSRAYDLLAESCNAPQNAFSERDTAAPTIHLPAHLSVDVTDRSEATPDGKRREATLSATVLFYLVRGVPPGLIVKLLAGTQRSRISPLQEIESERLLQSFSPVDAINPADSERVGDEDAYTESAKDTTRETSPSGGIPKLENDAIDQASTEEIGGTFDRDVWQCSNLICAKGMRLLRQRLDHPSPEPLITIITRRCRMVKGVEVMLACKNGENPESWIHLLSLSVTTDPTALIKVLDYVCSEWRSKFKEFYSGLLRGDDPDNIERAIQNLLGLPENVGNSLNIYQCAEADKRLEWTDAGVHIDNCGTSSDGVHVGAESVCWARSLVLLNALSPTD